MTDDTHTRDGPLDDLGGMLVTYRMAIYLGGLAVIGFPLAWREVTGETLPQSVRAAITVSVVSLMVATYLFERRLGIDDDDAHGADDGGDAAADPGGADAREAGDASVEGHETYPLRSRAAVAAAVLGLAAGVYVGLETSPLMGLLFVAGSYLFAYLAYDRDGAGGPDREPDGGAR